MDFSPNNNSIISYLYAHSSKSFKEFIGSFYQFKGYSNNILETEKYLIFDSIIPTIDENLIKRYYLTLREFYKQSKKSKRLNNLICLFFYKFKTITKITINKENEIISIYNPYKELSRVISYPIDKDFTHLLTITYSHALNKTIFETMQDNEKHRKRVNRGIHRLRNYVYKKLKDELKKKITDKKELNEKVKELKKKVFKYFKVYELHASNHLHAHILIKLPSFITKKSFKEIISKFANWFDTSPIGIDLKRIKKDKNGVVGYVLKYMFKQFKDDNVFYVENEKKEKIYFIKKDAIVRNDIPRMISRSRNTKTKKFKPFLKVEKEEKTEKKEIKEITRIERELQKRHYGEFKEYLKNFKTTREKLLEYEIDQASKRNEVLEKLRDFLEGRYYSIKDILRCLDFCKLDKIIQDRFYTIYQQATHKINRLLEELEKTEEIEIIDF